MSKRCKLQKEYYKEFGNYKGSGKYTDHYVSWLESRVLALTIPVVVGQSERLFCGECGNKRELIVETDLNSGRVCKNRLCKSK
jgi:hypothetical protein